jgi:hypothetical protein
MSERAAEDAADLAAAREALADIEVNGAVSWEVVKATLDIPADAAARPPAPSLDPAAS